MLIVRIAHPVVVLGTHAIVYTYNIKRWGKFNITMYIGWLRQRIPGNVFKCVHCIICYKAELWNKG